VRYHTTQTRSAPAHNLRSLTAEEFRRLKRKGGKKRKQGPEEGDDGDDAVPVPEPEQKRTLGLIILRGESIVSLSVEGPPPAEKTPSGPGVSAEWSSAALGVGPGLELSVVVRMSWTC
jgi:small nuclear ribonucleoprotein B and B'